ncbi:ABC transporter permease [Nocardioides guangzhouensis]|nr:ABC transporter permease [Nocardioides guangzhouensis]
MDTITAPPAEQTVIPDRPVPPARPRLSRRRVWLLPVILILGLAAVLPAIYLSATADPQGHLKNLPVALVVEEQNPSATSGTATTAADQISAHVGEAVQLVTMDRGELAKAMAEDQVAGAVVIPATFDADIASLLPGATTTVVPTVTILTNAGDGGLSNGLVIRNLTPVLRGVAQALGAQLADSSAAPLPAANQALLAEPFRVTSEPFKQLPDDSGLGTSAFYYALVLVLLAFIGGSLVGPLVDGAVGFLPSEVGPKVIRRPYIAVTRRHSFLSKTGILVAVSPLAALAVQLVAAAVGMTAPDPLLLWLFATTTIAAIGTAVLALFAAFGPGIGSLVNTLLFVALAMVSSGGVVPTEAVPAPFAAVSHLAPFHHVVEGTRSLFYFDGNLAAGLGSAWISMVAVGAIGLLGGLLVTTAYGRIPAFTRDPKAAA